MYNLLTILGATATGKTSLAVRLAAELKGEIISADSRQIYRGMDLGTGKDLNEYVHEGTSVPYHLIDIADAGFRFNLFMYQQEFLKVWQDCERRGVFPVLCGGSGLYVESILKAYRGRYSRMRMKGRLFLIISIMGIMKQDYAIH